MAELCLMASHGFHPLEYLPCRFSSKDSKHLLSNFGFNHDMHRLSLCQRMDKMEMGFKSTNGMVEYEFSNVHPNMRRPILIDYQDFPPNLLLNLTVKPYVNHESALRFFLSRPSDGESDTGDMSKFFDFVGPQAARMQMPQEPLPPYHLQLLLDAESQPSLLYPIKEFSSVQPLSIGDLQYGCINHLREDQLLVANSCIGMKYIPRTPFEAYFSLNNANNWKKQQMLVPYFDRRIRKAAKTNSHGSTSVAETVKRKVKNKGLPKKKKNNNAKAIKERDHCRTNYLYECESLLSIVVDKKFHGKTLINFLKQSGPEIPKLLTQFSATIAGTGLAVVFSVVCKVVYGRVPFCGSKLMSTGLGLGLLWLSLAVNKLRDTVISINNNKNNRKLQSAVGDEEMMSNLDRNVREIYFRAIIIMAIAFLRFA